MAPKSKYEKSLLRVGKVRPFNLMRERLLQIIFSSEHVCAVGEHETSNCALRVKSARRGRGRGRGRALAGSHLLVRVSSSLAKALKLGGTRNCCALRPFCIVVVLVLCVCCACRCPLGYTHAGRGFCVYEGGWKLGA